MTDEDLDYDEIEPVVCRACESEYIVILADDLLEAKVAFCPFCCEPVVE